MIKHCYCGLAAVCLMAGLCLFAQAPPQAAAAERAMSASTPGTSMYTMSASKIDWSRRYELTPLEMKRLRAKGLTDNEIYAVANGATMSGWPIDELVQKVFRGETVDMIAMDLNLSPTVLTEPMPMWKTPEWEQAVRDGAVFVPVTTTMSAPASGMSR